MAEQNSPLVEILADVEHQRWAGWMNHQFAKGSFIEENGTWVMPKERVERWKKLSQIPYSQLSEELKEFDRVECRKTLAAIEAHQQTVVTEMDKSIKCLALELPEPVWDDINKKWQTLKQHLTKE